MHSAFCIATWYNAMNGKTIYALGYFDGVHLGHQALLRACRELADQIAGKAGVVTFAGHPDRLIHGVAPKLINTPQDRNMLLRQYHMDTVVELPFDEQLMRMPWRDFFRLLMEEYHAAGLVCGEDFRFGDRGMGNAELLLSACKEAGIPCVIVPQQKLDGITVSSTHIRALLETGRLEEANRFLGHPHLLRGQVVPGRKLGRTMGTPTANILLPEGVVTLPHGVYACKAGACLAVTNIGSRPTVGGHQTRTESWLLDYAGDLYGRELTLEFYRFLRPERKFDSLEELKAQIQTDAAQTRQFFEP